MFRLRAAAVVLVSLCAIVARATELGFVEVSQIMFEPSEGFHVQAVTYTAHLGSLEPGMEVRMMTYPNCVLGEGWNSAGRKAWVHHNQNVINILGVGASVEGQSPYVQWRLGDVVDTLRVGIHFETAGDAFKEGGRASREFNTTAEGFAETLVKCVLANAARSRPRVLNVAITFHGAPEANRLSRVYPVPHP